MKRQKEEVRIKKGKACGFGKRFCIFCLHSYFLIHNSYFPAEVGS